MLSCLSAVFASTAWADPIEVTASVFGQIGGRDGSDGSDYFISPGNSIDSDPVFASVSNYQFAGGDGVNLGSLTGAAFARHPEDHGDPAFLGIDLQGEFTASRAPTGGLNSFFPAGSMSVGLVASAEYRDEVTIELEHPDVLASVDMFVYLHGFAELDAVATGGIDPKNVAARVVGRFFGSGDNPVVFGAIKKATGEVTLPVPGALNILDFNPIINFSYDIISGVPFPLFLKLELTGSADFGDVSFATLSPGFAHASFGAHFSNTLEWGGITKIVDRRTGDEITDYHITSAAGFDYTQTFSIPEPNAVVLMFVGALAIVRRRS